MIHVSRNGHTHFGEFGECRNLLEYINTVTPFNLPAPCGGKGRCGKCRVIVTDGDAPPVSGEERRLLSAKDLDRGVRLACMILPRGDLTVVLEEEKTGVGNKSFLITDAMEHQPSLRKETLILPEPHLHDQASDHSRILREIGLDSSALPLPVLRELAEAVRGNGFLVTLCRSGGEILAVETGDTRDKLYGIAVDIGTTTVAAYLTDIASGKNIDVVSGLNAQEAFGADVISRINYTMTHPSGLRLLSERILDQIDMMILTLATRNEIEPSHIYTVVLTGNTTMLHLALGLPPENIASSPFISVTTESHTIPARELGLSIAPGGQVNVLPSISGYVGADIVAAVLAGGIAESDPLCLLIDIGTNGEIVLGNRERLIACSPAAGPAFEGAHVKSGVGGIAGAVNMVTESGNSLSFTTIAEAPPLGICGSGIVDLLALLLRSGIVDETGRMLSRDEAARLPGPPSAGILDRLIESDGEPAFLLVPEAESSVGSPIMLSQKDVREIQLAKAAIAAGIDTLVLRLGVRMEDITTLYLAGGFGSYIHKASAVGIGLLPGELHDRIRVIGNAAGKGALMTLLSHRRQGQCESIRRMTEYIELSSSPEFQEAYIDRMMFPQ